MSDPDKQDVRHLSAAALDGGLFNAGWRTDYLRVPVFADADLHHTLCAVLGTAPDTPVIICGADQVPTDADWAYVVFRPSDADLQHKSAQSYSDCQNHSPQP